MIRNKEGLDAILRKREEELETTNRKQKEELLKVDGYYDEIAQYFSQLIDVVDTLNYMHQHLIQTPKIFYLIPECNCETGEDSCNELDIFQICDNATFNMFINPYEKTVKIQRKTDLNNITIDLQSKHECDKWRLQMYCQTFIENVIKALPEDLNKFFEEIDKINL